MSRFGFCGPSYSSQSVNADAQECINWYFEPDESGAGKSSGFLYPSPGLKPFAIFPVATAMRAEYAINGRMFAVASGIFAEIKSDGSLANQNGVADDGKPASIVSSASQLLIVSGLHAYSFDLGTNIFTDITSKLVGIPIMGEYLDGFFIVLFQSSAKFQISALNDVTTWNAADVAIVSVFPDNVTSMIVDHRELWMCGAKACVAYVNTGNPDFPLEPVLSSYIEGGIASQWGRSKLDNTVFWVGLDERGSAIAFRANGYTPQRISNFAVEFAWSQYATVADAITYSFQDQGHPFWHVYFPSADVSWRYDVATGMWHKVLFWDATLGIYHAHHSQVHCYAFGKHLVGDWASGVIYEMNIKYLDDNGNAIRRLRRAPHVSSEQEWIRHNSLQVDVETGLNNVGGSSGSGSPAGPSFFHLVLGATGSIGKFVMEDNGSLVLLTEEMKAVDLILANSPNGASWQLIAGNGGALSFTLVGSNPSYPQTFQMVTVGGLQGIIAVSSSGVVQASVIPSTPATASRDPQLMLRWSNDGAHTFTDFIPMSAGSQGDYKKRVIWRRLGRSRDRVYELVATDAVPWRIVDAYLDAAPGFQRGTERIASSIRKVS